VGHPGTPADAGRRRRSQARQCGACRAFAERPLRLPQGIRMSSGSLLSRRVTCLVVEVVRRRIGFSPVGLRSWLVLGSDGTAGSVTEGRLGGGGTLGLAFTVEEGAGAGPGWPGRVLV
jgi:hypothetical protein